MVYCINMDDLLEITDLGSSSFGGGLDLLVNTDRMKDKKHSSSSSSSSLHFEDLNDLENELNDLANQTDRSAPSSAPSSSSSSAFDIKPSVSFNEPDLGRATSNTAQESSSWDGYKKYNNVPVNPDATISMDPKMDKETMMKEKIALLNKLKKLEQKGIELSKKYSMESSFSEMRAEYDSHTEEKERSNSIKFQGQCLLTFVNGIEFLNNKLNPFDIQLDGWNESVQDKLSDYDEVFSEMHDKYKSKINAGPEFTLLFNLASSAILVHMTNSMFKNSMPSVDDVFRQNPNLMRSFQEATLNSMSHTTPGFSGFMNNMMNTTTVPGPGPSGGPSGIPFKGGPPPPIATQSSQYQSNGFERTPRPGNNSYGSLHEGISMKEKPPPSGGGGGVRPNMKGPGDLGDILGGLKIKTKTIDIAAETGSTISMSDAHDLQTGDNVPKRSGRRKKTPNAMSLDL